MSFIKSTIIIICKGAMFTLMTMNWFNALFVVKAKATAALFLEVLLYEKLLQVLNWRYVLLELYRTNDQFGKFGISFFKLMKNLQKRETCRDCHLELSSHYFDLKKTHTLNRGIPKFYWCPWFKPCLWTSSHLSGSTHK